MVKKKNSIIQYEALKTHITEEDNLVLLKLTNTLKEFISDIRECGIRRLSFYDIEKLEEESEKVTDLLRFKHKKDESSKWCNTYGDRVLPTDDKAWYPEMEED
jgi:hypothetical protein